MAELDKSKAVELLNRILEAELAGVFRYTHYSCAAGRRDDHSSWRLSFPRYRAAARHPGPFTVTEGAPKIS
jgi:hypothetical protein